MHQGNPMQFLCSQVRARTLRLFGDAPDGALRWTPPGTQNHILWHAGHALWVGDVLCIEPATGRSELPADWARRFGMNCTPPAEQTDWPSRDEIASRLTRQGERLFQLLGELTEHQLNAAPKGGATGDSLVGWIVHGFHDEAIHQGEMKLLLKLYRQVHP